MGKFNKYLDSGEELLLETRIRRKAYFIFLIYFLIILVFFVLYPMFHLGRQSTWLWIGLLFILTFFLARRLVAVYDRVLLTDQRIIFLEAISKDYFKIKAYLPLEHIKKIVPRGEADLYIYTEFSHHHLKISDRNHFLNLLRQ
ncbi:MAG: hypothetical protein C3F02_00865 [Parcubacteria group bacterium]|nr:MAG: hypothetical protein C3F02_00865 [Parcubacteria group bacterium]